LPVAANPLRVDKVEAFPISLKAGEKLRSGAQTYTHFQTVLVRADCGGVEGWGEAMTRYDQEATALLVRHLGRAVAGDEFEDPAQAWQRLWRSLRSKGHTRGTDVEALSGIEIALFDCFGKESGKPVSRLLSARPRASVPAYAGSIFASRGSLAKQAEVLSDSGLAGAKVKVGFGLREDALLLREVRRLIPEGMLVADANCSYTLPTAAKAKAAFQEFGLAWLEEPLPSDDFDGYLALKKARGTPVGAGESWFVSDFDGPVRDRSVQVVEPSVSRCGGIGVAAAVAKRCRDRGIGFSPMTGLNSPLSLAASIQVAAAAPATIGVECDPFPNPLAEPFWGLPPPKEGRRGVPSGPGLGVTVDVRVVERLSGARTGLR
jgi:D-galactarolactone cycloisomerase